MGACWLLIPVFLGGDGDLASVFPAAEGGQDVSVEAVREQSESAVTRPVVIPCSFPA